MTREEMKGYMMNKMTPAQFRALLAKMDMQNKKLARLLGFSDLSHISRMKKEKHLKAHKPVMPHTLHLLALLVEYHRATGEWPDMEELKAQLFEYIEQAAE